uniref:Uncharacterized protein n=1 Tax=Picocystis salinarum TaxID=88271 RepID=A0A7S3U974_9CHLO
MERGTLSWTSEVEVLPPGCSKSTSKSAMDAEPRQRWREDAVCFLLHLCNKTDAHFQVKFLSLQIYKEQLLPYMAQHPSKTVDLLRTHPPVLLSTVCCLVASKLLEGTNHQRIQKLWCVIAEEADAQDVQNCHEEDIKQVELCLMEVIVHSNVSSCMKLTSDHVFEICEVCQASMIVCEKFLHLDACLNVLESLHVGTFLSSPLLSQGGAKLAAAIILVSMVLTIPSSWKTPVPLLSFLCAIADQDKEEIRGTAIAILQHVSKHGKLLLSCRK